MDKMIEFDKIKLNRLKKAYQKALNENKQMNESFTFDGNEYVLGYAKYLIEYLETQIK